MAQAFDILSFARLAHLINRTAQPKPDVPPADAYPAPTVASPKQGWTLEKIMQEFAGPKEAH